MAAEADKIRAKLQSYSVASHNELCPLQDYHAIAVLMTWACLAGGARGIAALATCACVTGVLHVVR